MANWPSLHSMSAFRKSNNGSKSQWFPYMYIDRLGLPIAIIKYSKVIPGNGLPKAIVPVDLAVKRAEGKETSGSPYSHN